MNIIWVWRTSRSFINYFTKQQGTFLLLLMFSLDPFPLREGKKTKKIKKTAAPSHEYLKIISAKLKVQSLSVF